MPAAHDDEPPTGTRHAPPVALPLHGTRIRTGPGPSGRRAVV